MSTVPDREAAARQSTGQRLSRGLWRWGSSQGALLVVLLLLAVTLALSYTFPQASVYVRSDPITYEEWLSGVQIHYRRWTPLLRTAGLFHVRDTLWFRVLLALVVVVLLVSIGDRVGRLVEEWQVVHAQAFYSPKGIRLTTALAADEVVERVRQVLAALGMRVGQAKEGSVTHLWARQRAWARADALLSLLGALAMVTALGANSRWGWSEPAVQVLSNQVVTAGPQGDHRLELVPGDDASRGAWVKADSSARVFIDRERGASRGALRYELADQGGPLVNVSATNRQGAPLDVAEYTLRPEPQPKLQLAFSSESAEQDVRLFLLPEAKTVVRLEWHGADSPHFEQWAFEQGAQQLVGTAQITATEGPVTTRIGDIVYHWEVSSYAVVALAYQPGRWLLGIGAVLALLGVAMQFVPCQQAWARIQVTDEGTTIELREDGNSSDQRQATCQAVLGALELEAENS